METPVKLLRLDDVLDIVRRRMAIYQGKAEAADPLAPDDSNCHERMTHTVEALEHLESEITNFAR